MVRGQLRWEPGQGAPPPRPARPVHKGPHTASACPGKRRPGEATVRGTPHARCFCSFDLGQVLAENLAAEVGIEMWT